MKQARVERDRAKGKAEKTAEARQEKNRPASAASGSTAPEKQK
jgi:hypothetical protein